VGYSAAGRCRRGLITLNRKAGTRGYFAANRFVGRKIENVVHELAVNPSTFIGRTNEGHNALSKSKCAFDLHRVPARDGDEVNGNEEACPPCSQKS
jgi:hypothetical protein